MTKTCPPLPTGSVDLSVLHEADAKGQDLAKALERATARAGAPKAKGAPAPAPTETEKPGKSQKPANSLAVQRGDA